LRLARRCALALLASKLLVAQLATGVVEGTLSGPDGRPSPDTAIFITGNLGFHTQILTGAGGEFAVTLIYGVYRLRTGGRSVPVVVNVAPLRTTRVTL
jgi:hypothetical protein